MLHLSDPAVVEIQSVPEDSLQHYEICIQDLCLWTSPGKNTGMGHFTQESS